MIRTRAGAKKEEDNPTILLQDRHRDKVPTFANVKINGSTSMTHQGCIDSGSAISVIDAGFLKRHLPKVVMRSDSMIRLEGVGSNLTQGWVQLDLIFSDTKGNTFQLAGAFHVVVSIATNIIIGNDILVYHGLNLNLAEGWAKFRNSECMIPIATTQPQKDITIDSARVKQVYTIQPGHQARVPITLAGVPQTELYMIDPAPGSDDYQVARTIGISEADAHFAHVLNMGTETIILKEGTVLGSVCAVKDKVKDSAMINHSSVQLDPSEEEEQIEEAIADMDINDALTEEQRDQLKDVIKRQRQAFAYGSRTLNHRDLATMRIDTGDSAPISQPPYHASPKARRIIDDTIAELLAEDIIEESDSPWASPAILVSQKGKDRFCIEYRKINEVTKADQYPIPRIDDILSHFSGATYFTTFDANKGFHQIEVDEADRQKTAFRTHRGLHQYKRMPFGLKSGPAVFQRLMDKVLGRYKWQIALVYIDDIIIYSKDFNEHLQDIDTVLGLVAKSGITLSPKKCHIAYQSLNALGHNISNLGIGTSDNNVEAVRKFPQPKNVKELQRFLGLCVYYRKFVKDFAKIAQPLYSLLKKDQRYVWGEGQQSAFEELKMRLTTAPVLAYPDYDKPFILHTDASCGPRRCSRST